MHKIPIITVLLFFFFKITYSQTCEGVFTTEIYYTNPCTAEDHINDDAYLNSTVETANAYKIFYRTNDPGVNTNCSSGLDIEKPIIIIEGFDIMDDISPQDIYDYYLNGTSYDAGDALRNLGYDIITFNITYVVGPIHFNAEILSDFIQYINEEKNTNEDIILIGVSMGGLISRYALAKMEANNIEHQTKLFLSFDAPQYGAHVPLSLQLMSYDLAIISFIALLIAGYDDNLATLIDLYSKLRSPAALEMNMFDMFHIQDGRVYPADCYQTFRDDIENLNSCNGFPLGSKNVAISNGSYSAQKQEGLDDIGDLSGNPSIGFNIEEWFYFWLKTFPGEDNPSANDVEIYSRAPDILIDNYREPIEHVPGGYYPWYGIVKDQINVQENMNLDYYHNENANYIPTISALGMDYSGYFVPLTNYTKEIITDWSNFDDIWWDPNQNNMYHASLNEDIADFIYTSIINANQIYSLYYDRLIESTPPQFLLGKKELVRAAHNISINNVTVSNNTDLRIEAGNEILLGPNITINLGSELNLNTFPIIQKNCD